jgi:beta-glucosidase
LRGFEKVFLKKGEAKKLTFSVQKKDLAFYDEKLSSFVEEDIVYIAYVGTDSENATKNKIEFRFKQK